MKIGPEGFRDVSEEEFAALNLAVEASVPTLSGVRFETLYNYAIGLDPPITGKFIGGAGITDRTIDSIERTIPTVHERLSRETGKIIFLGNGLSGVPLIAAERYLNGVIKEPPVIVDVFDYGLLQKDYENIIENCRKSNCELPLCVQPAYETLRAINQAVQDGHLKAIIYYVGSEKVPADLKNASLVINCMGPNAESIREQISMLSIGGDLYTHYYLENPGNNTLLTLIPSPDNYLGGGERDIAAYIYTRIS